MPRALKMAKELVARGLYSIANPQIYPDLAELGHAFTEVPGAVMAACAEIQEEDSRPSKEKNNPPAHQFIWDSSFFGRRMLIKFALEGSRPNCLIWGLHAPAYKD
jgi:hypothetical protein